MNNKFLLVALFAAWCLGFASCDKDKGNEPDNPTQGEQTGQSDSTEGEEDISKFETSISGTENGFDYVDLGLPSGLKWATCNVGADSPEEYGYYYAWGETTTKSDYSMSGYQYYNSGYVNIGSNISGTRYDVACAQWGGSWRLPTKAEFEELINRCTWTWTTQNGVKGRKVTSMSNGNSIFLPAAGYYSGSSLYQAGKDGYYWSSMLHTTYKSDAFFLEFTSTNLYITNMERNLGLLIRPVCP